MGFSTAEITSVRALPVVLAVGDDGEVHAEATFAEVVFQSTAQGKHHQVYVDGRLAGTTLSAEDDRVLTPMPEAAASLLEVVAVDADDRLTDFSAQLAGFADAEAARVELSWFGGRYLDDNLDHFEVYGGPAGSVDYGRPLNAEPIEALVGGENLGGFGRGGFGRGGFGRSAMAFSFVTAKFPPGIYDFEILAVDTEGNLTDGPPEVTQTEVRSFPRPPTDLAVSAYDDQTQTATLVWSPSEDV